MSFNSIKAGSVLSLLSACLITPAFAAPEEQKLRTTLEERLPETAIGPISCGSFGGLCEVMTGKNIVYTDVDGTVLIIGRVFSMETGDDLTAAALEKHAIVGPPAPEPAAKRVSWSALPEDAAIVRNEGAPHSIAVFSDLNCGYCHKLDSELRSLGDFEVREHLVGILGGDEQAKSVWCAEDRHAALDAAYRREALPPGDCDADDLKQNTSFFTDQNFYGTPVIIRSDGAVIEGYRDAAFLRTWIMEGASE